MSELTDALPYRAAPAISVAADPHDSVCALFERQCDRTPDAVAVRCDDRALTYRQLEAAVSRLARYLRERCGVGPEMIVGLLLGRSERMLISMLAVLKAGGAYAPISPDYPANRVAYILQDAKPAQLITEAMHMPLVEQYQGTLLSWDPRPPWQDWPDARLDGLPVPRQLAYVIYTSGSTGNPKGVMAEHLNLSNFIVWCFDEYRHSTFDIVYAGTPYGFDLSNIELYFPLAIGRPMRLLRASQTMGLYLRRDRNVLINTVPSLVQEMLRTDAILDNVSVLNLGGEAIPASLARTLLSKPGLEVRNMYGPTETTSTSINYRMDGAATAEVLIGKPIANMVAYVLDDDLRQVPAGGKGEICIGGYGLTRGYWNRPELTRQRFVPDPYREGELMYRSGDAGMLLPDGNFRYLGRTDNQVKIRGYRIELDEVGNTLAGHPGVREAVVGVKATIAGPRLSAVIMASSEGVQPAELESFARANLPPYMVPEDFTIVEAFPLTPSGKIDRQALFG